MPRLFAGRYQVLAELGRGGMGRVLRVRDLKLARDVALKVLPVGPHDDDQRRRLEQEARAAGALNHRNIVAVHDVGEEAGEPFIVTELLEGETLRSVLSRRRLLPAEVLALGAEFAEGLAAAHEKGIVHRDLKPENLFLTNEGHLKILDFGIAKMTGARQVTGAPHTHTGAIMGTVGYMSPEQVRGEPADLRSDVFSFGAILYEMLSGTVAFEGGSAVETGYAILNDEPAPLAAQVPRELDRIVRRCLEKDPEARFQSAHDLALALVKMPVPARPYSWRRPSALAAVAVTLTLAGVIAFGSWQRRRERSLRAAELPQLQALVAADDCAQAFDLAVRLESQLPGDPQVRALAEACCSPVQLQTDPPGALVSFRPYDAADSAFRPLGRTPLSDVRLPNGVGVFRFELAGHATVLRVQRNPGLGLGNVRDQNELQRLAGADFTVPLPADGTLPPGMVLVPATRLPVAVVSSAPVEIAAYYLGRLEVTNREFKEFVDAGGYRLERLWRDLPFGAVPWRKAVARFVDSTGRPGPSTWEAGSYADGRAEHPVAGVSWFEATAYARFRGMELPTAYHWYRAAFSVHEIMESISAAVARRGNYQGRGTEPAGQRADLGPYGTSDMAGNVREWLSTPQGAMRMIAGGAFNQAPYLYYETDAADPWDRSAGNGLRLMRTADGAPVAEGLQGPVEERQEKIADPRPVDDAVWAVLKQQMSRSGAPLDARQEEAPPGGGAWRRETISLATGYDEGRFRVQLFLPEGRPPPWQVVFLLPHAGYFRVPEQSAAFDPSATGQRLDFLMKAGRALVLVVFDGMFERRWSDARRAAISSGERYRILLRHHREELGRTLDYLQGRKDFARAGVLGFSWGAQTMMALLAVEPRLGPAVLIGGGVYHLPGLPLAEQPFNYYPRVRQPVLMLSGRWDIDVGTSAQEAMLRLLGTTEADKKRIVFDTGHGWVPQNQFVRQSLDWYDRYLGPVQ